MYRVIASMIAILGLFGCQSGSMGGGSSAKKGDSIANTRYELLNRGYSVDYVDAYELGCASIADKNTSKDSSRYANSKEYKRGWDQGVATCKNPYGAISRQVIKDKMKSTSGNDLWKEMKK